MNFKPQAAEKPAPVMKQSPKPSFPCLPRIAIAALVVIAVLIGVLT